MERSSKIAYYSLFYIDRTEHLHSNLPGEQNPIDIYLCCALTAAASAKAIGATFTVVTNSREFIERRLDELGVPSGFAVLQLDFDRVVPKGIQFYSAHFKLDVMKYFGQLRTESWIGLIDLDAVFLRKVSPPQEGGSVLAYDISRQVPATAMDRASSEMTEIAGGSLRVKAWYGGEFLVGTPDFYAELTQKIDSIWSRYCDRIDRIFHVGMEWPVSIGLRMLEAEGLKIVECGQDNSVARWWSARALVQQASFAVARKTSFLHLPSDKPFLAKQATVAFDPDQFLQSYETYVRPRLLKRKITNPFLNYVRREERYVASLR